MYCHTFLLGKGSVLELSVVLQGTVLEFSCYTSATLVLKCHTSLDVYILVSLPQWLLPLTLLHEDISCELQSALHCLA